MKKYRILSLFLTLILLMSFMTIGFSVYGQDIDDDSITSLKRKQKGDFHASFNEYELLKQVNEEYQKSKKEQSSGSDSKFNNLSAEEIYMIENYMEAYSNKIYDLKEWEIEELQEVGYNNEQINAIKTFDGSEEKMALAATTVDVDVGFRNLNHSTSGTTVDLIAAFNANGISSNWFRDLFVVVWSTPLTVKSNSGCVGYVNRYGQKIYIEHTPRPNTLYGREIEFYKNSDGPGSDHYYIDAGSIILGLKSNTYVYDFATYASYGYTYLNISPSANVSYGGSGLGISFIIGMSEAGWAYDSI